MRMNITTRTLVVVSALCLTVACALPARAQGPTSGSPEANERNAVRTLVTEFGKRVREVAVLAPKAIAAKEMDDAYSAFVAPELLAAWKADPQRAPGKRTSSPSPERIDVSLIAADRRGGFVVTGKLILLTAQERRDGGIFQANPVVIKVAQQRGRWVITGYRETEAPP